MVAIVGRYRWGRMWQLREAAFFALPDKISVRQLWKGHEGARSELKKCPVLLAISQLRKFCNEALDRRGVALI